MFYAIRVGKEPLFIGIAESAVMKHQRGFYQPDTYFCLQPGTRSGGLTPGRVSLKRAHTGTAIRLQIWGSPWCGVGLCPVQWFRSLSHLAIQSWKMQFLRTFQTLFNPSLNNLSINLPNKPDSVGMRESSIVICKQQQLTACLITGYLIVTSVEKRI